MDKERARMSSVGLKAFGRIADAWGLTDDEARVLLGGRHHKDWSAEGGATGTVVDDATLERISLILGIYAALGVLVGDHDGMRRWLRSPNEAPLFKGGPALAYMVENDVEGLRAVRSYVDWHAYVGW